MMKERYKLWICVWLEEIQIVIVRAEVLKKRGANLNSNMSSLHITERGATELA
jgi:hypothetical protein